MLNRIPAVAGVFYSSDMQQLSDDVRHLLAAAQIFDLRAKALIVPHAGYIYSGIVAATAYATLRPFSTQINRVILLGPTHRVAIRAIALPGVHFFNTPLGSVKLDLDAIHAIEHFPQVIVSPEAHAQEHALEVQLPFLQTVLPEFTLLPLAVGIVSAEQVAEVLDVVWGGEDTIIVISSDLSHFLPYSEAKRIDNETVQSILQQRQPITHNHACGATPIGGLIVASQRHHLVPHLLDLRNSGDTAGSHDQVVGYAAIAFTRENQHAA